VKDRVTFLRARFDEDEQRWARLRDAVWPATVAVVPSDDTGEPGNDEPMGCVTIGPQYTPKNYARVWNPVQSEIAGLGTNFDYGWRYHESAIELLSPAVVGRMLAEVDTKRRILDLIPEIDNSDRLVESEWGSGPEWATMADRLLKLLVLLYANHPDYDPAWNLDRD
jgi:hypothetical protein